MAKRRDRYGRYRGKGGIKAYKSNLPMKAGKKRTKPTARNSAGKPSGKTGQWSKKKKIAVGVAIAGGAAGAVGAGVYLKRRDNIKKFKQKSADLRKPGVTLYHHTTKANAASIAKGGFKPTKYRYDGQRVFVSNKRDGYAAKGYGQGGGVVRVRYTGPLSDLKNDTEYTDVMGGRSAINGEMYSHLNVKNLTKNGRVTVLKARKVAKGKAR